MKKILILLLAFIIFTACGGKDNGPAGITGNAYLVGSNDNSGIVVLLKGTVYSAVTKADGSYGISNIPAGKYNILFIPPENRGYAKNTRSFNKYNLKSGNNRMTDIYISRGDTILTKDAAIYAVKFSKDNHYLVYSEEYKSLYCAPFSGQPVTLLYNASVEYSYINSYKISNDSKFVYFLAGESLYRTAIDGWSQPVHISDDVITFYLSNDSLSLLYKTDFELYAVNTSDLSSHKLLAENLPAYNEQLEISSDSTCAVFISADNKLYSVPIASGTPQLLNEDTDSFEISADSPYVVFSTYSKGLYSIMPDDVGTLTELTNNLADDYYKNFDISGGSLQVTYRTDNGLFSIPVGGGTATQLINNYIGNYIINNDGTFVFYYDDASSLHSYSLNNDTDIVLFYTPLSDFKILNNSSGILFNNLDLMGLISFAGEDLFEISRFTWDFSLGDLTYGYQISTDETFLIFIDSFYDGSKWISSLVRFDL